MLPLTNFQNRTLYSRPTIFNLCMFFQIYLKDYSVLTVLQNRLAKAKTPILHTSGNAKPQVWLLLLDFIISSDVYYYKQFLSLNQDNHIHYFLQVLVRNTWVECLV